MIIVKSIDEIIHMNECYSQIWAIVNTCKPGQLPARAIQVKELAPSNELFACYRDAVHNEEFNREWFDNEYVPRFLMELARNTQASKLLRALCESEKHGETMVLACFCENPRLCHRTIIANILYCMGADVSGYDDRCWDHYETYYNFLRCG